MGRIQSSVGLVTGVAIDDTVNQLMELNSLPRQRLESRNSLLQQEQVALTELTALVVGVELSTDRLGQESLYTATTATSNNTKALTVSSSGSPVKGSYSFVPVRQAQSQQHTSSLFASSEQKLNVGEIVVHTGGFLDASTSLDELNGGNGVSRGFVRITDRSGASATVDLRFAHNTADVVDAINATDGLRVIADVDGDHFTLSDVSGGSTSNLSVEEVNGGTTASDLGLSGISTASSSASGSSIQSLSEATGLNRLLDQRGLEFPAEGDALEFQLQDGSTVSFAPDFDASTASLGQLIDKINEAGGGSIAASISASGTSIEIEDLTSGASTFSVSSPSGSLAEQLGLDNASVGGVVTGDRLIAGLNDVLLSSLNGGAGLGQLGQIAIADRSGVSDTVDLSGAETIGDVVDAINASSAGVKAQLNRTKTGIELIDTTGSTANPLTITDADGTQSATALQIEGAFDAESVDSGSLHRQFVGRNTKLADYNQGRGVSLGSIKITDSKGASSAINFATLQPKTLGDAIDAINELSIDVTASINEAGDGLVIVDSAGGTENLTITDVGSSTTASDLGIAGESAEITVGGQTEVGIDGSLTVRFETTGDTSIAELAELINTTSQSPLSASVLNLNAAGGVRLLLNSTESGQRGRVAIDSTAGIGFSATAEARDALLAFGANETSGGVLVSSADNTFTGLVNDLEFTVNESSTSAVTVTVSENHDNITDQIETFVEQYNKVRDKYESVTEFNEDSQSVGILFGKSVSLRVDLAYGNLLSSNIRGAGSIGSLGQVGIRLNDQGKLSFDKAKFDAAYTKDPAAVKEFFTKEDVGFAAKAKSVADSLAGVDRGALLGRSNTLSQQIEQNTSRIDAMNIRLDKQRTRLLNQFYAMEQVISKLQQNLTSIDALQIITPAT